MSSNGWYVCCTFQFLLKLASQRLERPIHSPPHLWVVFLRLHVKQCWGWSCWTQDHSQPPVGEWNISLFQSLLPFPSSRQCCDALVCPCRESSSSFQAFLLCEARSDAWCACQSICQFIPLASDMAKAVGPHLLLHLQIVYGHIPVMAVRPRLLFSAGSLSVKIVAWVICVSLWEARHCTVCVTASVHGLTVGITVYVFSLSALLDSGPASRLTPVDWTVCVNHSVLWLAFGLSEHL